MNKDVLKACTGFQWDDGNSEKNWLVHQVSTSECEQFFFNQPLIVKDDDKHSLVEKRYFALGQTDQARKLFLVFTIRQSLIRVISARDMSKREREVYASEENT
ncbi:BrnT family toxin [Thiolapillus sp.]